MGYSPGVTRSSRHIRKRTRRTPFERRILWFSVLLVAPALLASGILLASRPWSLELKLVLLGLEVFVSWLIGIALHDHIVRPLQTLANVVGSLREEDYSFRARLAVPNDALGELSMEVNALADALARRRTGSMEAAALLQHIVAEVDIPIFAFDPVHKLRLINPAGEKLLQKPSVELLDKTAAEVGLETSLSCDNGTLISPPFASGARWFVRRSSFRQQGVPHTLLVLSDVSQALREEERVAWQRLIRVIGHELNNSLAPIKSIAGSLTARLSDAALDPEQREDFVRGLGIIEARAASLNRFLQAYRQLAQMPSPVLRPCPVPEMVARAAALETRVPVTVIPGPGVSLMADPDQLEQMFINLLRNAAEAVLEHPEAAGASADSSSSGNYEPEIACTWELTERDVVFTIEDNGPGLMNPNNAFVPFYTTKPAGSGIGLVLSRQIAEAHGGMLELSNRRDRRGCSVRVTLPRTKTNL